MTLFASAFAKPMTIRARLFLFDKPIKCFAFLFTFCFCVYFSRSYESRSIAFSKGHSEYAPITVLPRIHRPRIKFIQIRLLPISFRNVSFSKLSFAGNSVNNRPNRLTQCCTQFKPFREIDVRKRTVSEVSSTALGLHSRAVLETLGR